MTVKTCRPGPKGNEGTTDVCQRPDGTTCTRNYEQLKRSNVHISNPCILPAQQATPNPPTSPDQNQHTLLDPLPPTPALTTPLSNKTQKPIINKYPRVLNHTYMQLHADQTSPHPNHRQCPPFKMPCHLGSLCPWFPWPLQTTQQ